MAVAREGVGLRLAPGADCKNDDPSKLKNPSIKVAGAKIGVQQTDFSQKDTCAAAATGLQGTYKMDMHGVDGARRSPAPRSAPPPTARGRRRPCAARAPA